MEERFLGIDGLETDGGMDGVASGGLFQSMLMQRRLGDYQMVSARMAS